MKIEKSISPRFLDFRRRRGGCFKLKIEKGKALGVRVLSPFYLKWASIYQEFEN